MQLRQIGKWLRWKKLPGGLLPSARLNHEGTKGTKNIEHDDAEEAERNLLQHTTPTIALSGALSWQVLARRNKKSSCLARRRWFLGVRGSNIVEGDQVGEKLQMCQVCQCACTWIWHTA
jgi:hypothetical protein